MELVRSTEEWGKLSELTRGTYEARVRSLCRALGLGEAELERVMLAPEEYEAALSSHAGSSLSTRCNWMATLCSLFKYGEKMLEAKHGMERVKAARGSWQATFTRLKGEQEAEYGASGPRTAEQRVNYVRMDEIRPRYVEAMDGTEEKERHKTKTSSQGHVLLSYMAHMTPKRADLGALRVLRSEASATEWEGNYVLLLPPISKMVIRRHKTSKQHGALEERLPREMEADVEASLRYHPREYLLTGRDGGPLSNHDYVKLLQRTTQRLFGGRRGGVNLLRHAYVSESVDFNSTAYNELGAIAKQMGHSLKMQSQVYKWTSGNIPAGAASSPRELKGGDDATSPTSSPTSSPTASPMASPMALPGNANAAPPSRVRAWLDAEWLDQDWCDAYVERLRAACDLLGREEGLRSSCALEEVLLSRPWESKERMERADADVLSTLSSCLRYARPYLDALHGSEKVETLRKAWGAALERKQGSAAVRGMPSAVSTAEVERWHATQYEQLSEAERHETLDGSMLHLLLSLYVDTPVKPRRADLGTLRVLRSESEVASWAGNYVLLLTEEEKEEESRWCLRKHVMSFTRGALEGVLPSRLVSDLEASLCLHRRRYVFVSPASNGPLDLREYEELEQRALRLAAAASSTGRPLTLVWRCEEPGCIFAQEAYDDLGIRGRHAQYHAALRGECGEDDDAEERVPGLSAGYAKVKREGCAGCGAKHKDGKSCARPYVCEHDPVERMDGTKRLVRFKGVVNTTFRCCPVEGCKARARKASTMRQHLEAHHTGELLCKCEDCGDAFQTCGKLLEHVKQREHFFEMADPRGHLGDEVRVASVLRREGYRFSWHEQVQDRIVDFVLWTASTPSASEGGVICLEVDDNAHRGRTSLAELERMRKVAEVLGSGGTRPVTFIRYNVDAFTLNRMTKVNPPTEKRERRLLEELKKAEAYTRPLSIVYMFYDVYYDEAERRMLPSVMLRKDYNTEMKESCVGVVFNAVV